jgi:hypothetical protein
MLDDFVDWLIVLLPWQVVLALLALFVAGAGLLVYWAVYG